jgi:MFS family permease
MAWLVAAEALDFANLLALSLLAGIAGTFSGPPRDAMLNRVAGADIQRTVIVVIGLQFAAQILGFALASVTDRVGADLLLALTASLYALGALPCLALPAGKTSVAARRHPLRELAEGFAAAVHSPRVWPALVLTFALGIFFAGSFVVLLPLIVRDVYHGGAFELSLAFGCNMLGTVVMIGVMLRRGGVRHQGRAFMCGLLFGCAMLSFLYLRPPPWGFFLLSFVWGLGGGLTMTMGRAIVQESAPPELAARFLSLYGFGMTAGMPIGSITIGYAVAALGPLGAAWVPAIGMTLTVLIVHLTSDFWRVQTATADRGAQLAPTA